MALLSLVRAADRRLGLGLELAALHVDYGLRGADSDRDRQIVERACAAAGVPLHVERLAGRLAGRDFQARARAQRYGRARELAAEHGYDVIVTAHNRDDQAETVLYRLAKYASPRGLVGMRPRDGDPGAAAARRRGGGDQGVLPRRRHRVRGGRDQRGAAVRAQPAAPRGAAAARGAEPADRGDAGGRRRAGGGRGGGAGGGRRRGAPASGGAARPRTTCAAVDLAALAAEPPALRALVLHDLLRGAMGGDALVERRLVEALLRLAERTDDAGRVRPRPRPRGGARRAACCASAPSPPRTRARRPRSTARPSRPPARPAWSPASAAPSGASACCPGRCSTARPRSRRRGLRRPRGPPRRVTLRHPRRGERFAPLGLGGETTLARHLAAARVPAERRPLAVVLDVDGRAAWVGGAAPARVAQSFRVAHSTAVTLHVVQEGT